MKQSAGIVAYKIVQDVLSVFLVHPGGPFWKNKDLGSWSIPKGEFTIAELPLDAAVREFKEETGYKLSGDFIELSPVKLKSAKTVFAWALNKDLDANAISSNTFETEWPPKSGKLQSFPEIDRAAWFSIPEALSKINGAQSGLLLELQAKIVAL